MATVGPSQFRNNNNARAARKSIKFTSQFPYFTSIMRLTNVAGYKMRLPSWFSTFHISQKNGTLVLEDKNGTQWKANYFEDSKGSSRILLSGGWVHFVKDNYLTIGDICAFELLPNKTTTTLRVSIFRDSNVDGDRACPPRSKIASHGKEEKRKSLFKPKTSRFFKIILQDAVDQGRLAIPKSFARTYENDLPNQVFLEVPSGAVWKVGLVKCDDGLWLQNGWREFQEYYSIAHGSFLVFEYKRGSYFHVFIFDKSTSEIDYPYDDDSKEPTFQREYEEPRAGRNIDDNASVEILDDCCPSSKKREKLPLPYPRPPKVGRFSPALNPESNPKLHTSSSAKGGNEGVSSHKHEENRISKNTKVLGDDEKAKAFHRAVIKSNNLENLRGNTSRTSEIQEHATLTSLNKSRALKGAAGSKSGNPSFSVVMKSSHVNRNFPTIPFKFAMDHLKQKSGNVILQILGRKTWTVGYKIYSEYALARFSSGWPAFAGDNNLKTGTECVFELINPAELVLNVVIVRAGKEKIT